jgi:hypothetical protein
LVERLHDNKNGGDSSIFCLIISAVGVRTELPETS